MRNLDWDPEAVEYYKKEHEQKAEKEYFLLDQIIKIMDTSGVSLLTVGSAFVGQATLLLNEHNYLWAVVCAVVGVGLFFARDFVKQ